MGYVNFICVYRCIYTYKDMLHTCLHAHIYMFLLLLKRSDLEQNISGTNVQITQVYYLKSTFKFHNTSIQCVKSGAMYFETTFYLEFY